MKRFGIITGMAVAIGLILTCLCGNQESLAQSSSQNEGNERSDTYVLNVSTNLLIGSAPHMPRLASVINTFAAARTNTLTVSYVRSGVTNVILNHVSASPTKTVTALFESDIYLKTGDRLLVSNNAGTPASQLTLNWR